jgi:predicted nucleic acid-binding Zn ribbon protein
MPTYEYKYQSCGHRFDDFKLVTEKSIWKRATVLQGQATLQHKGN